ncbi:MAG TPA: thiopeptide-type bacteriocin biosynthesis protein [Actinokineospora sp.]|jgi:thiopeptide-type bacteriocin biosynthesis protein|nr:thiopeptide-type bacteriocin biosynthesis protein [Actinokineospora sp.]
MPTDYLTAPAPHHLANAVLLVLSGTDPDTAAAAHNLNLAELDDAIKRYQAAGLAALHQRCEHTWYDVRVEFPDWTSAETTAAQHLGPALDLLQTHGSIGGWWFLRKHPCWRLRLHHANVTTVGTLLDELVAAGTIARWWSTVYEPETTAFGGPRGMDIVHDLFRADSHAVLNHLRQPQTGLGRRELSILLLSGLLHAAGLDTFERGDVFAKVAHLRPAPAAADPHRIEQLANDLRAPLAIPAAPSDRVTTDKHIEPWFAAFHTAGRELGAAATGGHLDRGLRAILAHMVIFHWNRAGLSATSQSVLAHAARIALLPRS